VPEGLAGERVDVAVATMTGLSRANAAELASTGRIHRDDAQVSKSDRVKTGQWLTVDIPTPEVKTGPTVDLPIIYQDNDLVVVDKPPGVAAHSGTGWDGPTVLDSLLAAGVQVARSGPPERRGIVQRLDVGTSGLMMVAKSEVAYSVLKQMFRDRAVHKVYHAVVCGLPDPLRGTIDAPIGRLAGAFKFAVIAAGKPSITHYDLLEALVSSALLRVELETGRTHQIRVHLAAVGHPLVGDLFYGGDKALAQKASLGRQWLHACELAFDHPVTGLPVRFESGYPEDLAAALEALRES
jgi:23S rRNA pseudouridine1911/1915/1917 synthase